MITNEDEIKCNEFIKRVLESVGDKTLEEIQREHYLFVKDFIKKIEK
jgi:hypothetical protein